MKAGLFFWTGMHIIPPKLLETIINIRGLLLRKDDKSTKKISKKHTCPKTKACLGKPPNYTHLGVKALKEKSIQVEWQAGISIHLI